MSFYTLGTLFLISSYIPHAILIVLLLLLDAVLSFVFCLYNLFYVISDLFSRFIVFFLYCMASKATKFELGDIVKLSV